MKKISVIVPIHNCETFLNYSVKSIIDQTYENLEILLIENASTDRSAQICDEYEKNYPNVKAFHVDMPDLSNARNVGIENASGEFIGFMDGDDFLYKTFYEDLMKLIEDYDADIAEGGVFKVQLGSDYGKLIEEHNKVNVERIYNFTNVEALKKYYSTDIKEYVNKVIASNKLYKKELFEGIRYPVGRIHEDEGTTYKLFYRAKRVIETSKSLYGYILSPNSIMRKPFKTKRIDDAYKSFVESIEFFKDNNEEYLQSRAWLRYLEYCVDYCYTLENSINEDRFEYKDRMYKMFRDNFKWVEFIKKQDNTEEEKKIIEELEKLYNNDVKNLEIGWENIAKCMKKKLTNN